MTGRDVSASETFWGLLVKLRVAKLLENRELDEAITQGALLPFIEWCSPDTVKPDFFIADSPRVVPVGDDNLLIFSREQQLQMAMSPSYLGFRHFLVYPEISFAVERVVRTLNKRHRMNTQPAGSCAIGVKSVLPVSTERDFGSTKISLQKSFQVSTVAHKFHLMETIQRVVAGLESFLPTFSPYFVSHAVEIQEELLSNAIWDANPRLLRCPRSTQFELEKDEEVIVEWAFDGRFFGVSVIDSFGKFPESIVNGYVDFLFNKHARPPCDMRVDGGGAGIGLFMVLQRATLFSISVLPGKLTEMTAVIDFGSGSRGLLKGTHSFEFFRAVGDV